VQPVQLSGGFKGASSAEILGTIEAPAQKMRLYQAIESIYCYQIWLAWY
jgi:hypothetical protein